LLLLLLLMAVSNQTIQPDVPPEERRILMELYASAGGERWSTRSGWGTDSSVCDWWGVWCDFPDGDARRPVVAGLSLALNNLEGTLPSSLADLRHLNSLRLTGNRLSGVVPESLLRRWDRHDFEFEGYGNTFSNLVVRATVQYSASETLCSFTDDLRYRVEIDESRQRATFQSVRCVNTRSRDTYCLVREGPSPPSLARFSRGLRALGYTTFREEYDFPFSGVTHGVYLTTEAEWGDGTKRSVETYSGQGPIEVWSAQQLFLGLISEIGWERESRRPKCEFQK
jgi:hypothetical protein